VLRPKSRCKELRSQFVGDFFGFFGALKKGDFFGLHRKKVGGARRWEDGRLESSIAAGPSKSFTLRPLRERGRGVRGPRCGEERERVEQKSGDFFGVHPKKVPLIDVERRRDAVDLAQLLFPMLFFGPKGAPLCDTKYRRKILFRNFPARPMLQQTEKMFDRDSSLRCYTRARNEFRDIW
jgi:hypothetical protein